MNTCFQMQFLPLEQTPTNSFQQTKRQVNQRYDARTVPDTHRAANIRDVSCQNVSDRTYSVISQVCQSEKTSVKLIWNFCVSGVSCQVMLGPKDVQIGLCLNCDQWTIWCRLAVGRHVVVCLALFMSQVDKTRI